MTEDFDSLYREHASGVYKYLLSLTRNEQIAEELTAETFYRAMYSLKNYNGTCKFSVWLCQIAKHIWYQELDKKKKYDGNPLTEHLHATCKSPEEQALFRFDKIELYRAIRQLNTAMREVVHMRMTGEFSFAEIGEVMGESENWARVTFFRAKQKLQEVLLL
ncbi:RNA polymerase sigma factor [Paenibacillus yanchengensis]|uniref:RNA polymerase sigma factor n=1 Tax=Paenibacillus yanchengensis TaxID=2035833 RepID=A0ABW4YNU9_9BACL